MPYIRNGAIEMLQLRKNIGFASLLVIVAVFFVPAPVTRAASPATTRPIAERVEELIDQLSDLDPAVRERARLLTLNLGGDAYERAEAALERPDLPPAARLVLQRAMPRLKARARREQSDKAP